MTLAQHIVACARGWIGTRYHHQGRLKRTSQHYGGVDCLGLLIGVSQELNLHNARGDKLAAFDTCDYSRYPDGEVLAANLKKHLHEVPLSMMRPGDIALMRIDNSPQHLGVISQYGETLGLIHAYAQARRVVEHILDAQWREKIVAVFRVQIARSGI